MNHEMRGTLIGRGRTAEVLAWSEGRVLKLYYAGWPASAVEAEAHITHRVHGSGAGAPATEGIIEVEGRYGVIYERLDGPSLLNQTTTRPWTLIRTAHLLAELHAGMHARRVAGLPSQRKLLQAKIQAARPLSAAMKQAALTTLARMPDDEALCHGDFHPDNVVMSQRGPVILDWVEAASGHPLADVARTSLLMQTATVPPHVPGRHLIEMGRTLWHSLYLRRYCQLRAVSPGQVKVWMLPIVAARLGDGIPEEEPALLKAAERLVNSGQSGTSLITN